MSLKLLRALCLCLFELWPFAAPRDGMIRVLLCGLTIRMVSASCFVCSSPNIENHYGSFFENPREIQPAYIGRIIDCERNEFKTQDCPGPCFSLNVSSSETDSDFGTSYGCSSAIIPDEVDSEETCTTKTVSIRTSPIFSVTATYCLCSENNCNPPIHPVIRRRSKLEKATGKTVYLTNQSNDYTKSFSHNSSFHMLLLLLSLLITT